jgi:hypothetical protein
MQSMVEGFWHDDEGPHHRLRRSPSPRNLGEDTDGQLWSSTGAPGPLPLMESMAFWALDLLE